MELRQYWSLLRKWLWLVLLCTALAGATAYIVSRQSTKIYQASATLMVNQGSSDTAAAVYSDILSSERLARTYSNLLTTQPILEETATRLGIPVTGLKNTVTVAPVRDTQLLSIKVEGPNPALIAEIANTLPQVFIERNREMQIGRVSESKAGLQQEIDRTLEDIARTQQQLTAVTDAVQRTQLEASLAQYRSTYSNLINSYQQVSLAETRSINNIVVAEPAVIPENPIRPRTTTNALLAAVVGAMLALGAAFLIEYLDDTVKTPDDVSRVSNLVTLGAIARLKDTGGARQLIAWLSSKAPESEAYRTLRTNIQFSSVDKPIKTLMVTSSGPGEGKSTTTANLAVVMAQTGQKVIVVDTDLRRPVQHKVFGVPNNTGLTTAILSANPTSVSDYLQPTEVENLSVLTSGPIPPNPSELLGSHRMKQVVDVLAEAADLVLFDSPPVLAVTDAVVLGRQVDGVLLVADAGKTREQALMTASNELQKTGVNTLGIALNRLDTRRGGYYYYYYYYSDDETGQRRRSSRNGHSGNGAESAESGLKVRLPWQRKTA